MITTKDILMIVSAVTGFLIITVLGKRWGWYELIGGTNKLLREQNEELRNQNQYLKDEVEEMTKKNDQDRKDWTKKHEANIKQLSQMQGQIDVLKSIPLVNIDSTLKKIAEFNENLTFTNEQIVSTNNKILASLETTAKIAAEDRGILTGPDKTGV